MVKAIVPPEQLLKCAIRGGWDPLCNFLGNPAPDMPFLRVNDGKTPRLLLRVCIAITVLQAL